MYWFCDHIVIPIVPNLVAGVVSGYLVSRYFEFRLIAQRAMYPLRLFARDAEAAKQALDELQMAQHQFISQGFNSAKEPLQTIIDWARSHYDDATINVVDKQDVMMPRLEELRPRFYELFKV